MAKLCFFYLFLLIVISNAKCSILYIDDKKTSNLNALAVTSERVVASKLACANYCQIKHGRDNTQLWYRSGKCKCLTELPVEVVNGNNNNNEQSIMEETVDVYSMMKVPEVFICAYKWTLFISTTLYSRLSLHLKLISRPLYGLARLFSFRYLELYK